MAAALTNELATYCKLKLNLDNVKIGDEYSYMSLPFCVIDSVFSIGVRYSSTKNTVRNFCEYYNLNIYSPVRPPSRTNQLSITEFIHICRNHSSEENAAMIFKNRQRTSPTNGILKTEATLKFAEVLQKHGVEYFQDISIVLDNRTFASEITQIPGQRSGISTSYFYMLAGSDNFIKPDRQVIAFIYDSTHQIMTIDETREALCNVHSILKLEYPSLTLRELDYAIWSFQRESSTPNSTKTHQQGARGTSPSHL